MRGPTELKRLVLWRPTADELKPEALAQNADKLAALAVHPIVISLSEKLLSTLLQCARVMSVRKLLNAVGAPDDTVAFEHAANELQSALRRRGLRTFVCRGPKVDGSLLEPLFMAGCVVITTESQIGQMDCSGTRFAILPFLDR